MLEIAQKHQTELNALKLNTWFNEKYKYWNYSVYYDATLLPTSTWTQNDFVSLDSEHNVIGYIGYSIDRTSNFAFGLSIMNFSDNKWTFGMDVAQAIDDIFVKYKFMKLNFSVVVGNRIEKSYDKLIKRYGGRIVGTREKETTLVDGNLYDVKMYELFRENYLESKMSNSNLHGYSSHSSYNC